MALPPAAGGMPEDARPSAASRRSVSRRTLLTSGLGAALASGLAGTGETGNRPPGVGGKFDADGRVRPWPGNTIICFARTEPALWQVLDALQDAARTEPVMRAFTLLPSSSFHMTLFAGVDEDHRRLPYWPASLPTDMPLAQVRDWCRNRLETFHTGGGRFRMRIEHPAPTKTVKAFTLRLSPADAAEADRLRDIRRRLSERLQIVPPDLETYAFHITLGYLIDRLTPDETEGFNRLQDLWLARIVREVESFSIGPPTLCDFEDMVSFTPVLTLAD